MPNAALSGRGWLTPEIPLTSTIRWGDPTVRDPMSRSRTTVRGLIYNAKDNRYIATESEIERRLALTALLWSIVKSVCEQPLVLSVEGPEPFKSFPDFCLTLGSKQKLIIETKLSKELKDPDLRARLTRVAFALQEHDLLYCVVTERDFNPPNNIANLRLLTKYLDYPLEQLLPAIHAVSLAQPTNFGRLVAVAGSSDAALALIAQNYVSADLRHPLAKQTLVTLGANNGQPLFHGWHPTDNRWQGLEDC